MATLSATLWRLVILLATILSATRMGEPSQRKLSVNWLKKQLATPHIEKVMHNAMYDLGWLRWAGIEVQGPIIDTMIAAPLLNENRRFYNSELVWLVSTLGSARTRRCFKAAAAEMHGVNPKSGMWQLPC